MRHQTYFNFRLLLKKEYEAVESLPYSLIATIKPALLVVLFCFQISRIKTSIHPSKISRQHINLQYTANYFLTFVVYK